MECINHLNKALELCEEINTDVLGTDLSSENIQLISRQLKNVCKILATFNELDLTAEELSIFKKVERSFYPKYTLLSNAYLLVKIKSA